MILSKIIQRIKINALFLFILPTIGIIGSLLINNYIVSFNYEKIEIRKYLTNEPGNEFIIDCTKDNNYCGGENVENFISEKSLKIDDCSKYNVNTEYRIYDVNFNKITELDVTGLTIHESNKEIDNLMSQGYGTIVIKNPSRKNSLVVDILNKYQNNKISYREYVANTKNLRCIKNYQIQYFFYKYFPPFSFFIDKISVWTEGSHLSLGTSVKVNPFLYGETSISNLVKRYPINYFFKSFLYIGIILMFVYWHGYNKIFKIIIDKRKNTFYFFGIASAFCLFFHIYFLGTTSDSEILKVFRRIIIILFILFELLAQTFLAFKIYKYKNIFTKYSYNLIVLIKIIFVSIVLFTSMSIVLFLIFYNFPSNIDNILEWNYFIILLIFYLFSSLMWKKKINW